MEEEKVKLHWQRPLKNDLLSASVGKRTLLAIKIAYHRGKQIQKEAKKNIVRKQYATKRKMTKFASSLRIYRDEKLWNQLPPLATKTARTQVGMESNWVWMTEMGNSLHIASNLCHSYKPY